MGFVMMIWGIRMIVYNIYSVYDYRNVAHIGTFRTAEGAQRHAESMAMWQDDAKISWKGDDEDQVLYGVYDNDVYYEVVRVEVED